MIGPIVLALELAAFGAIPNAGDATPGWNAAMAAARAGPDRTVRLQAGQYYFFTPSDPIPRDVTVEGQGMLATTLMPRYALGKWDAFIRLWEVGSTLRRLTIWAGPDHHGTGIGLSLAAWEGAGMPQGYHVVEDVTITGPSDGLWNVSLLAIGDQKISAPIGIRLLSLRNVRVYGGASYAAALWGCVSCEWFGGGAWQGLGANGRVYVGGTNAQKNLVLCDCIEMVVSPGALR